MPPHRTGGGGEQRSHHYWRQGFDFLKIFFDRKRCPQVIGFTAKDVLAVPYGARVGGIIFFCDGFFGKQRRCGKPSSGTGFTNESKLTIISILELPTCLYGEWVN